MPRRSAAVAAVVLVLLTSASACSDDEGADGPDPAREDTTTTAPAGDRSSTTTESPPSTTTAAPTGEQGGPDIALRGDGLGVVTLGAPPEEAVEAVTETMGPPTLDTGWQPSFGTYGTCPGTEIRAVEWDGLALLFTDEATPQGAGRHLFAWRLSGTPPPLATAEGFGLGATTADARELYGDRVEEVPPEEPFPGFLEIEVAGGTITAFLEGDVVTFLEGGTPCGE